MLNTEETAPFVPPDLLAAVVARLTSGRRVRRTLPGGGRLHIDRRLPFMVVYRSPADRADLGMRRLILSQPAYLAATADSRYQTELQQFVAAIVEPLSVQFGAFLLVEVWSGFRQGSEPSVEAGFASLTHGGEPRFRVVTPDRQSDLSAARTLVSELRGIELDGRAARAKGVKRRIVAPPEMGPIIDPLQAKRLDCYLIGLEIDPIHRDVLTGELYPHVVRELASQLTDAFRHSFFRFVHDKTEARPASHHGLGRRAVVRAVGEVDRELADICDSYDFLLAVTPVNAMEAFESFQTSGCKSEPAFRYRWLTHDPELLLRRLYQVPLEDLEDPTLERIFREKVREVGRQLSMLTERNTPDFLYGSLQLFGDVEEDLLQLAQGILAAPPDGPPDADRSVSAQDFARMATRFLDELRARYAGFDAGIEIRDDTSSLLVSKGRLLVPSDLRLSPLRARALVHHEAGTHLLTYANGTAQPLALLHTGLAGYEALQEGLAVLSEFLVGGLDRNRFRLLAARVVAVARVIEGASFAEIFDELTTAHGLTRRTAFITTMRVRRAGGFTKDVVYLRGVKALLSYLGEEGDLDILFLGKMALRHAPLIQELLAREVLRPPPLRPPCLELADARERLAWLREGHSVLELPEASLEMVPRKNGI
ncbi:MAG: flavohemoglobin expression-modulating QEGLA motif protein [Longimicrobiales bacterium]